jgi:hypothetical protein
VSAQISLANADALPTREAGVSQVSHPSRAISTGVKDFMLVFAPQALIRLLNYDSSEFVVPEEAVRSFSR